MAASLSKRLKTEKYFGSFGNFGDGRLRACTTRADLGEARALWTQVISPLKNTSHLSCLQPSGNITAVQLKSLDSMGLAINDDMFDRLWASDRTAFPGSAEGLTASDAEACLLELCQGLFLRLLTAFRKVDNSDDGSVSLEKFKGILEKTFQIQLTEEQLQGAVSVIGDKETNLISYTKLFTPFHNRPTTCELKEEVERCSPLIHVNFCSDKLCYRESFKGDWSGYSHAQKIRPLQENEYNTPCNGTGKLWYSLPVSYPAEAISLRKFLRHFSKLKIEKESGPREENPVALTQIKLRNHIIKQWKQIKSILKASDPSGSGKVPLRVVYALFLTLKYNYY